MLAMDYNTFINLFKVKRKLAQANPLLKSTCVSKTGIKSQSF